MSKTPEELNALKTEYKALTKKLKELTDDELMQVTGGNGVLGDEEIIWLYEVSHDANQAGNPTGSRQAVIGEWDNVEHSKPF